MTASISNLASLFTIHINQAIHRPTLAQNSRIRM